MNKKRIIITALIIFVVVLLIIAGLIIKNRGNMGDRDREISKEDSSIDINEFIEDNKYDGSDMIVEDDSKSYDGDDSYIQNHDGTTETDNASIETDDNYDNFKLNVGQNKSISNSKSDEDAKWSSKDESVATVSDDGVVTGVDTGTTTITKTTGEETKEYEITVEYLSSDEILPIISVPDVNANAGDKDVVVNIEIKNNPGILGLTLAVEYDEKAMALTGIENGEALDGILSLTKAKELKSGCKFTWDGVNIKKSDIKDGDILILHFNVSDSTEAGDYEINMKSEEGDIVNEKLIPVDVSIENGIVKIQ